MRMRSAPVFGLAAIMALLVSVAACQGNADEVANLEEANAALTSENAGLQAVNTDMQSLLTRLSYNTSSGGGVNLKMMPDPTTGKATVGMEEVFTFDRNHAICRVDTNPVAFVMPTFAMGDVKIEPNQFFMSMESTSIESYEVTTLENGSRQVVMRGGLDCNTEVGQATVTFGDRNESEYATFRVTATDGGVGGGEANDSFEYTVFFDKEEAPLNYAIFGPEFTFTGEMIAGEVTIVDPNG